MVRLRSFVSFLAALSFLIVIVGASTDHQLQKISDLIQEMKNQYDTQINGLAKRIDQQDEKIIRQDKKILRQEEKIVQQDVFIRRLFRLFNEIIPSEVENNALLNTTIEERVALLEIQVVEILEDVTILTENDNFLFDEQVIQDERLFSLETETEGIEEEVEVLEDTTLALDFRVTVLEENGGGDGNSSVAELEVRVETLEATTADHETRISVAETDISELQTMDDSLDARVTALEESGGGSSANETVAFQAYVLTDTSVPIGETVVFETVLFNQGSGYDETTGVFTVPAGADGLYFFSTYLLTPFAERGVFDITLNDEIVCSAYGDGVNSGGFIQGTCTAIVWATQGDEVKVVAQQGDGTPIEDTLTSRWNGFNGYKI